MRPTWALHMLLIATFGGAVCVFVLWVAYILGWLRERRRAMMYGACLHLLGQALHWAASGVQLIVGWPQPWIDGAQLLAALLVIGGAGAVLGKDNRNFNSGESNRPRPKS